MAEPQPSPIDGELFLAGRQQARLSIEGRDYSGRPCLDETLERQLLEASLEPTRYGTLLFDALFTGAEGDLLAGYRESLALARHQERRLRLRLHIANAAPAALHRLHWELLYDSNRRLALARSRQVAFSRYLGVPLDPGSVVVDRPRLLVAVANPGDLADYGLSRGEPEALRRSVEQALGPLADTVEHHTLEPPITVERIRDRLVEERFHALHLHAHGVVDGNGVVDGDGGVASLVLEGPSGCAAFVDERLFSEVFEGQRGLRLVTLIACHGGTPSGHDPFSGLGPALVRRGIPAVIAMRRQITLTAARRFSQHLYRNLARDPRIDVAVGEARQQLYLADAESPEWSTPLLFMRQREGLLWRPGDPTRGTRRDDDPEPPPQGWQAAPGQGLPRRPHWQMERKLGAGGFGEAWLASHRKTGERRVFKFCHDASRLGALQREITLFRLLKEELGDRDDIARILDWDFDHAPYCIESDYAAGGNLLEWAEEQGGISQIPLPRRLELVAQVATALAAAHSVGVLHKDVKPSNVLIAHHDADELRIRLADFGIGALTDRERLSAAGITALGLSTEDEDSSSTSGTRLYMAPEILEGKRPSLQADIYALGVLLYQLLVGDFTRALAPGWRRDIDDELLREDLAAMVDGSPERRPGDALRIAERLRRLDARRQQREEERRERQAAREAREALARSRRRRKLVAAVFAILLVFAGSMGYHARRLAQEAERTRQEAERANREALLARQAMEFLKGLFEVSNPAVGQGETITARELLDRGAEKIRRELADQPLTRASLMDTMGTVYRQLGLYEPAMPLLEEALQLRRESLGGDHPEVAASLASLAKIRRLQSSLEAAEALYLRSLEILEADRDPHESQLPETMNDLGLVYLLQGRHGEAEELIRRAVSLLESMEPTDEMILIRTFNSLAMLHSTLGRYGEAQALYERNLRRLLESQSPETPTLATAYENLGTIHHQQARLDKAEGFYGQALEVRQRILDPEHPHTARLLGNFAALREQQGKIREAESLYSEALRINEKNLGRDHPSVAIGLNNLALLCRQDGRLEEAESHYLEAARTFEQSLGEDHLHLASSLNGLAGIYHQQGRHERAEPIYRRALTIRERTLASEHPDLVDTLTHFASCLRAMGRDSEALAIEQRLAAVAAPSP